MECLGDVFLFRNYSSGPYCHPQLWPLGPMFDTPALYIYIPVVFVTYFYPRFFKNPFIFILFVAKFFVILRHVFVYIFFYPSLGSIESKLINICSSG